MILQHFLSLESEVALDVLLVCQSFIHCEEKRWMVSDFLGLIVAFNLQLSTEIFIYSLQLSKVFFLSVFVCDFMTQAGWKLCIFQHICNQYNDSFIFVKEEEALQNKKCC